MFYVYSYRDVELTPRSEGLLSRLAKFARRLREPEQEVLPPPYVAESDARAMAAALREARGDVKPIDTEADDGYTYLRKKAA